MLLRFLVFQVLDAPGFQKLMKGYVSFFACTSNCFISSPKNSLVLRNSLGTNETRLVLNGLVIVLSQVNKSSVGLLS